MPGGGAFCLEPDLGWMLFREVDPAQALAQYAGCCPVIHLKDLYARDFSRVGKGEEVGEEKARPDKGYFEFRHTGFGMLNLPRLMPLCLDCRPEWFVVDHDLSYERDPYSDLKASLDYVNQLLAYC